MVLVRRPTNRQLRLKAESSGAAYGRRVTVYVIVQLTIHDRVRYQRYADALVPILTQYGGTALAVDDNTQVIEGQWHGDRVVLLAFPDQDAFMACATSAEYQQIVGDRLAATDTVAMLVQGLS